MSENDLALLMAIFHGNVLVPSIFSVRYTLKCIQYGEIILPSILETTVAKITEILTDLMTNGQCSNIDFLNLFTTLDLIMQKTNQYRPKLFDSLYFTLLNQKELENSEDAIEFCEFLKNSEEYTKVITRFDVLKAHLASEQLMIIPCLNCAGVITFESKNEEFIQAYVGQTSRFGT